MNGNWAVLRDVMWRLGCRTGRHFEMETIFGYVNRLGVELPIEGSTSR